MERNLEHIFVEDLAVKAGLEVLTTITGNDRIVADDSVFRPTSELSGDFEFFEPNRVQVFGNGEFKRLNRLITDGKCDIALQDYVAYDEIPMVVFSRNNLPDRCFVDLCEAAGIPVYLSSLNTTMLIAKISQVLREFFAPQISVHGVMLSVFGVGVLIQGRSSIGKSETALELLSRGNSQLVSDDRVVLYETEPGMLVARAPKVLEQMIEIRGIGIVDVLSMYGVGAYRQTKRLTLVIELQDWDKDFQYNRIGAETEYSRFLDTQITKIILPVHTGRNVASLIEAAALNHQLKELGVNTAEEFIARLTNAITENSVVDKLED